jgi:hypothetical protein
MPYRGIADAWGLVTASKSTTNSIRDAASSPKPTPSVSANSGRLEGRALAALRQGRGTFVLTRATLSPLSLPDARWRTACARTASVGVTPREGIALSIVGQAACGPTAHHAGDI